MASRIVIGHVYGRLTVLDEAEPVTYRKHGTFGSTYEKRRFLCRCICGRQKIIRMEHIVSGRIRSCGCLLRETSRERMKAMDKRGNKNRETHGQTNSPEFYIWRTMKARCNNPKSAAYPRYGGRDISVCARWLHSFENFLEDMGPRPSPRHSIGRINNDGDYEPSNCAWQTPNEQHGNKSTTVALTFKGETLTAAEWARRLGVNRVLISQRLRDGWSVEDTLTEPPTARDMRTVRRRKP